MTTDLISNMPAATNEPRTRLPRTTSAAQSEIEARDGSVAWVIAIYLGGFATIALTWLVGLSAH